MPKIDKSWFDRPYEVWRQRTKGAPQQSGKEALSKSRGRRLFIVFVAALTLSIASLGWTFFSDIALWHKEGVSNFGIWMFALFVIGNPLGLYLASKPHSGPLFRLQILATLVGGVGALGMLLLPIFLYANYALDFSRPDIIPVTVSDIKWVGNVGKRSLRYTLTMTKEPFETQTLTDQQRRYSHLRSGENAWLVSGSGFFGLRYVREIRSNSSVQRDGLSVAPDLQR